MKIIALLALVIFMSSCSILNPGKTIGYAIIDHCHSYKDKLEVDRCFTDSEFVLDQLE